MTARKKEHKPLPRNPRVRCEDPSGYVYVRKSDSPNRYLTRRPFRKTVFFKSSTTLSQFSISDGENEVDDHKH